MSLSSFHPVIQRWFAETLGEPTPAQRKGWASIREKRHALISAPTGSGKTLAAFLTALDDLFQEGLRGPLPDEVRVVYVSPLKALSADIHKNLAEPRKGIRRIAEEMGLEAPRITAAVRTGDTTQAERASMLRTPPHILVTTPESLYLLLTSARSREMLRTARVVIVDEIHAVIGTRRGAHLALSLERLQQVASAPLLRLGLSATQKPIDQVARYLTGSADSGCAIVDEGHRREMDLGVELPQSNLETVMAHEVWEDYYNRLAELISAHRTTLVFVNTRRLAERVARHLTDRLGEEAVTAHHGSLSKEKRFDAEGRLKEGRLKALVATASLELGIDIGHVDLVCQIGSPHRIATLLQRVGRSGHTVSGMPKGRLFPVSRDDLFECAALLRSVRRGELDRIVEQDHPLDVLAQQIVAESSCREYSEGEMFALVQRAWPYRALSRQDFDAVLKMVGEGFDTRRGRRGALVHRDEVNSLMRGRRGSRLLALTSGGAIPEVADYRVLLEPEDTFIGTLNEDFAIESMAGDIFQLGNVSWQILQVGSGFVRVTDAKGAPPTIPFWLGEAPARSDELSRAVSDLRADIEKQMSPQSLVPSPQSGEDRGPGTGDRGLEFVATWLVGETGIQIEGARELVAYLSEAKRILGALPTQETLVLERFFDESGGMQVILHAPFGSRINKAWGLALRKRFCRQFNFELQAAATEDAVLLSLGPQHSFPLADVFRYLHPNTARDILVQAFLDAPVWKTRWRWNSTISLAVPRYRGGARVAPQLQRSMADDLMAAVFPDAAACLENVAGDREIPDHPLVNQAVRDCLQEAMDFAGLAAVLMRIHGGEIQCVARDTPEPSPLSHEILNARPYAFLDDTPLEERRAAAVYTRRATDPSSANDLGALDAAAIERVRDEQRPDPRDADELHDVLLTAGFLTVEEASEIPSALLDELVVARRAGQVRSLWITAERLPELSAIELEERGRLGRRSTGGLARGGSEPESAAEPAADRRAGPPALPFSAPASRASKIWTREQALVELLRGRMTIVGPVTAAVLADSAGVSESDMQTGLLTLESEGAVLRGHFTPGQSELEWCDRRLLARIHRYTLNRLRAEIEPVSPADFMRFLFAWHHLTPSTKLTGIDGLRVLVGILDGYEVAADAWERYVLPSRMDHFDSSLLDMLCLTGQVGWARLSPPPAAGLTGLVGATPIALFVREHGDVWQSMRLTVDDSVLSQPAREILESLRTQGALFLKGADRDAIAELVSAGLVTSDGFAGLRMLIRSGRSDQSGRWSVLRNEDVNQESAIELQARVLLRRYGVVFRRLLTRETNAAPWRELARIYRRLEARGEIRGGRFVSGMSGEQFALPEAVDRLRELRREGADGRLLILSAADPLNLTGIVTLGERVRAVAGSRIAYRDGVPVSVMEGDYLRTLAEMETAVASEAATALAGRPVPVSSGYVGRL